VRAQIGERLPAEALGTASLKGMAAPVEVYAVTRPSPR